MGIFKKIKWQDYALALILILSFFLNFWVLAKEGYSNAYYSAAVKSMMQSPKAFFFASLDTGLYVTIDKPPLGLWLQTISAKVFGVNSFGLIFPSALAGCLCVLLVYAMVKKTWGATAGVIAGSIVATTPILVALSRTNNMDMILLFFLLCGAYFILKAAKKQSLPLYLLAMVFVGFGFNVKMLQAFLVVPAFLLVYWLGKGKISKKIIHTVIAVIVLLAVSFSWALYVDSVPADERPYIGSSTTNSVMELALGYNGLSRLTGQQSRGGGMAMGGNTGGPGGEQESGTKGVFRLYTQQLSGLVSWFLLPAAAMVLLAAGGCIYWLWKRKSLDWTEERYDKLRSLVFWSAWLVPMAVFFSIGGFIHRYYVVMLCPAIAALAAAAAVLSWRSKYKFWLVPIAFTATLGMQAVIVLYASWTWLLIPMLACGGLAILFFEGRKKVLQIIGAVFMAASLFAAPAAYAATPVFYTLNSTIPSAGPESPGGQFNMGMGQRAPGGQGNGGQFSPSQDGGTPPDSGGGSQGTQTTSLNQFLLENYKGERWIIAVSSAGDAESIILATGLPVMAIGGFSGSDQILTLGKLEQYVANGELRYFMLSGGRGFGPGGSSGISQWVQAHGKAVTIGSTTIYDLTQSG